MVIIVTPFENFQVEQYEGYVSPGCRSSARALTFRASKAIYLDEKSRTTKTKKEIAARHYQRIYTTSAQLESPAFQSLFKKEKWAKSVIAIAVDDVHPVAEREDLLQPRYKELAELRYCKRHTIPLVVLSSTPPRYEYYLIARTLGLVDPTKINIGCDLPSVSMSVRELKARTVMSRGRCPNWKRYEPEANTSFPFQNAQLTNEVDPPPN